MRVSLTANWPAVVDTLEVRDTDDTLRFVVRAKGFALRDQLRILDGAGAEVARLQAGWLGGYTLMQGEAGRWPRSVGTRSCWQVSKSR